MIDLRTCRLAGRKAMKRESVPGNGNDWSHVRSRQPRNRGGRMDKKAYATLVKAVTAEINAEKENIEIEGLPSVKSEAQAEGMSDIFGQVSESAVKLALTKHLPAFFRAIAENYETE